MSRSTHSDVRSDTDEAFDPDASLEALSAPTDHHEFLSSLNIEVTPAPVQRSVAQAVKETTARTVEAARENWVPTLLMAIALCTLVLLLVDRASS